MQLPADASASQSVCSPMINDMAAHHLQSARDTAVSAPSVCLFIDMAMIELRRQIPDLEPLPVGVQISPLDSIPVRGRRMKRYAPIK